MFEQIFGYSNRRLRSRQNITDQPHAPTPSWCPTLWAPCTVQDLDGNEIAWEDVPIWAQEFAPGLVGKGDNWQNASGPAGLAESGGGGPTLTIENVVASSSFCDAWLIDSNYPAVRLTGLRQEGCAALYRNTGVYAPYTDRTRFSDVLTDCSTCSSGGLDGNVITYNKDGPLYITGGTFHGPVAVSPSAIVLNIGANFWNWNQTDVSPLNSPFLSALTKAAREFLRDGNGLPQPSRQAVV